MVHDLLFHTLLLLGLLGLSVSLIWVWLRYHAATSHAITRPTRRSSAHRPCPGLTHKPSCATCEDGAQEQAKTLPSVPSPIVTIRAGPRTVDTQHHFCPSPRCDYYGWVECGNVRANGHPSGGRWRQLQCVACRTYFLETHGTPLHGKRVAPELVVSAVSALAEGLGIHAVARVFEVDPNTVLQLYHVYYNFCLPHASLRRPLPQPLPTNGMGSAKRWRPRTPAIAAGLTDHLWTLREVFLYRVPPWPQPQGL